MNHYETKLFGKEPQIILLHEGLGSLSTWGNFPQMLFEATGLGVFVYSRLNYGNSPNKNLPLNINYMEEEADILHDILKKSDFKEGFILGHSDGATIASIYMGKYKNERVRGLSLVAPHFFVEDISIEAIKKAKDAYEQGTLKEKLSKHHKNVDRAFYGWNDAWLNPDFRSYSIEALLQNIPCPIQFIQGLNDPYGTLAQLESLKRHARAPIIETLFENCGHNPFREKPEECLNALVSFMNVSS